MAARPRLWLLFGGLAVVSAAVLGGAGWLATTGRAPPWWCWAGAAFVLVAIQAALWCLLERIWLQPSVTLAREVELLLHTGLERPIMPLRWHGLGPLPKAVETLAERWRTSSAEQRVALDRATARLREQQSRLEALLRDLSDGVIACTADRRILLFNDAAVRILAGHPELGLDRPLDRLIAREPIVHAFDAVAELHGRPDRRRPERGRSEFVCATADGAKLLRCRMAPILGPDERPNGFVLDFIDASARLGQSEQRELQIVRRIEALRPPVAALRAAAEVLGGEPPPGATEQAAFLEVVSHESATLSARVEELCRAAADLVAGAWPSADLFSADLVRWTNRRLAGAGPDLIAVGTGLWLHGDGYHLTLVLAALARRIGSATGGGALDLAGPRARPAHRARPGVARGAARRRHPRDLARPPARAAAALSLPARCADPPRQRAVEPATRPGRPRPRASAAAQTRTTPGWHDGGRTTAAATGVL